MSLFHDNAALLPEGQTLPDALEGLVEGQCGLLAGNHILAGHHPGADLVVSQKHHIGDADLVGIVHLGLELLLLGVELGPHSGCPQPGGQLDGGGQLRRHGQDQHICRSRGQLGVQHSLLAQHVEQSRQADRDAYAGQLPVGLPKEFSEYDSSRFHYAVVAGLREDYNEATYRDRRNKVTQQNILTLHYDNLYDKACELETAQSF